MLKFMSERAKDLTAAEVSLLTLYSLAILKEEAPTAQMFATALAEVYTLALLPDEVPTEQMFVTVLEDLDEFLKTNKDPAGSFDGWFAGWFDRPEVGSLDGSQIIDGIRIEGMDAERSHLTWNVSGKVLEVSPGKKYVNMHLLGLSGDRDEAWILTPYELPEWAFEGAIFNAQLSRDVTTLEQLATRPWALRDFPELASLPITDAELDELSQAFEELSVKEEAS